MIFKKCYFLFKYQYFHARTKMLLTRLLPTLRETNLLVFPTSDLSDYLLACDRLYSALVYLWMLVVFSLSLYIYTYIYIRTRAILYNPILAQEGGDQGSL